jgi:hypothetical protein
LLCGFCERREGFVAAFAQLLLCRKLSMGIYYRDANQLHRVSFAGRIIHRHAMHIDWLDYGRRVDDSAWSLELHVNR